MKSKTGAGLAGRQGGWCWPVIAGIVACAPFAAAASAIFPLPAGQSLTLGGGSNPRTVQSAASNPAGPVTADLGRFWFGLGSAGAAYETGDFDDLVDQADQLADDLDRTDISPAEAPALETRAEAFLQQLNEKAYVKVFAKAQPPLLPLGGSFTALGGAFTLGATAVSGARVRFLSDGNVSIVEQGTTDPCTASCELDTDFAGYGKGAAGGVVSLGYSGGTLHRPDGSLFIGGRLNYYSLELSRGVVALDDDGDDDGADTEDGFEDEFDRNRVEGQDLGLDLGLLWAARNFRAGVTLLNVGEPSFDYAALGQDCGAKAGAARRNCEAAQAQIAAGAVPAVERYTLEQQVQLETAVFSASRMWSLAATYDVDAVPDATGDLHQWIAVSAAFTPRNWGWLVPGLRAGYRQNQAGSELDLLSFGLSLFRVLNVDVAASTQSVDHDGDEVPRSAMANVSLELFF